MSSWYLGDGLTWYVSTKDTQYKFRKRHSETLSGQQTTGSLFQMEVGVPYNAEVLIESNKATFWINGQFYYSTTLVKGDAANRAKVGFTSVNGIGSSTISNFRHIGSNATPFLIEYNPDQNFHVNLINSASDFAYGVNFTTKRDSNSFQASSQTFSVLYSVACTVSTIQFSSQIVNTSYKIGDTLLQIEIPTIIQTPDCQDEYILTTTQSDDSMLPVFIVFANDQIQISSSTGLDVGNYVIKVQASILLNSSVSTTVSFNLAVTCIVSDLQWQALVAETFYSIGQQQLEIQMPQVTQIPDCQASLTYEVTLQNGNILPTFIQMSNNQSILVQSTNGLDVGTYPIRIKVSSQMTPVFQSTLDINLIVTCTAASIQFTSQMPDASYKIGSQLLQLSVPQIRYSPDCNQAYDVTATRSDNTSLPTFILLSNRQIYIQSATNSDVGSYSIKVQASSVSNPAMTSTVSFNLFVLCTVYNLAWTTKPQASTSLFVKSSSNPFQLQFQTSRDNGCQTPVAFTLSNSHPQISFVATNTGGYVEVIGQTLNDQTIVTLKLEGLIDDQAISFGFQLIIIQECGIQMSPELTNLSFTALIGIQMNFQLPVIVDNASLLDDADYCGPSIVSILGNLTQISTYENQILRMNDLSSQDIGLYNAQLKRSFGSFQLMYEISMDVIQPFVLSMHPNITEYNLAENYTLPYRQVSLSETSLKQTMAQLDYLNIKDNTLKNSFFDSLLSSFKQSILPPIDTFLKNLSSTSKVIVQGNTTASVTPNGTQAFDFFDDSVFDINSTVLLFQKTEIKLKTQSIVTITDSYGQVKIKRDYKCQQMKLVPRSQLQSMYSKIGQNTTQFFVNATDTLGVLQKNATACGKQIQMITLTNSNDLAPGFIKVVNDEIVVYSNDPQNIGSYQFDLKSSFIGTNFNVDIRQPFQVVISAQDKQSLNPILLTNRLPSFDGFSNNLPLPKQTVMTGVPTTIQLPPVRDDDEQKVQVIVFFGHQELQSCGCLLYDNNSNEIKFTLPLDFDDKSEQLFVQLSDSYASVLYYYPLSVSKFKEDQKSNKSNSTGIELDQQDILPAFLVDFLIGDKSLEQKRQQFEMAITSCIPQKFNVNQNGEIYLVFSNEVKLNVTDSFIQQIKQSGSIQLQLIKADRGDYSSPTNFTWTIEQYNSFTLRLRVKFEDPTQISATSFGQDSLRIIFFDSSEFLSCPNIFGNRRLSTMPRDFEIIVQVPQPIFQLEIQPTSVVAIQALTKTPAVSQSILSNVGFNYVNGLSAQLLWGGINAMQIISCSALYNVVLPPDSQPVFQYLKNMTKFDIYNPIDKLNTSFSYSDPYNERFNNLGYSSLNFYDAMGSITILVIYIVSVQLITPVVQLAARRLKPCIKRKNQHLEFLFDQVARLKIFTEYRYSVVNTWIRFFIEAYIELIISSMLAFFSSKYILEKTHADSFAITSAYITAILIFSFTLLVCIQSLFLVRQSVLKQKLDLTQTRLSNLIINVKKQVVNKKQIEVQEKIETQQPQTERSLISSDLESQMNQLPSNLDDAIELSMIKVQLFPKPRPQFERSNTNFSIVEQIAKHAPRLLIQEENSSDFNSMDLSDSRDGPFNLSEINSRPRQQSVDQQGLPKLSFLQPFQNTSSRPFMPSLIVQEYKSEMSEVDEDGEQIIATTAKKVQDSVKPLEEKKNSGQFLRLKSDVSVKSAISAGRAFNDNQSIVSHNTKLQKGQFFRRNKLTAKHVLQHAQLRTLYGNDQNKKFNLLLFKSATIKKQQEARSKQKKHAISQKYFKVLKIGLRKGSFTSKLFHLFFILRRISLLAFAFVFQDVPALQSLTFLLGSMTMLTYVAAVHPFEDMTENFLEIFNETFVLIVSYHFIMLSQIDFNVNQMKGMGISLNTSIGIMGVFNCLLLTWQSVIALKNFVLKWQKFVSQRKVAKVCDFPVEKQSNKILRRKKTEKKNSYHAYYPLHDVPEEGDLIWLYEVVPFEWLSNDLLNAYRRNIFLRPRKETIGYDRFSDFRGVYGSEINDLTQQIYEKNNKLSDFVSNHVSQSDLLVMSPELQQCSDHVRSLANSAFQQHQNGSSLRLRPDTPRFPNTPLISGLMTIKHETISIELNELSQKSDRTKLEFDNQQADLVQQNALFISQQEDRFSSSME